MIVQQITHEKFSTPIVCPDCGQTGVILWEMGRSHSSRQKTILLSQGFDETPIETSTGNPQIVCQLCDGLVTY